MKKALYSTPYALRSKKAIAPVIATTLLLMVTIVTGLTGYNWYTGFVTNFEAKQMQAYTSNLDESLTVLALRNESSTYNLYLKNSLNGYIIINEIKINDDTCTLPDTNVILGNQIVPIEVDCINITSLNDITVITDIGIINTKKTLS